MVGHPAAAAPPAALRMEQSGYAAEHGGCLADGRRGASRQDRLRGRNYREHADELGHALAPDPILFLKPPSSVIGDGDAIVLPRLPAGLSRIDYEGELVAIVGSRLRHATPAAALEGVRGYTCGNDVTARGDPGRRGAVDPGQGVRHLLRPRAPGGRPRPLGCGILTRVNGQVRQRASSREMVLGVGELLAYISDCMTSAG